MGTSFSNKVATGRFKDNYQISDSLGFGSYSEVRYCRRYADNQEFAAKIIKLKKLTVKEKVSIEREIQILTDLEHPHIIKVEEVYVSSKSAYLVLEYMEGGELFDRIVKTDKFSESEVVHYIKQIAEAIFYLHERGIAHRDLKPENILLPHSDSNEIKVGDFGLAKPFGEKWGETFTLKTCAGSPQYTAPEVLSNDSYGPEVDMWSLGVILFILLSGTSPFERGGEAQTMRAIRNADYSIDGPQWEGVSTSAKELVTSLLVLDVSQRPTAKDVLAHPWINGINVSNKKFGSHLTDGLRRLSMSSKNRKSIRGTGGTTLGLQNLQMQQMLRQIEPEDDSDDILDNKI